MAKGQRTTSLAIMFADISRSVRLYEKHGDVLATRIVVAVLDLLERVAKSYAGRKIKTIGDEILCSFPEAAAAVSAAKEMHKAVASDEMLRKFAIAVRIGLHYGDVLEEDGDMFGDAVNVASRAVDLAKAEQIITTRDSVERLPENKKREVRSLGKLKVHGRNRSMEFFEVLWQEDSLGQTLLLDSRDDTLNFISSRLVLSYRGGRLEIESGHPPLHLGRGEQNNMVVSSRYASRRHAEVRNRNGKFLLIDFSVNGTYVYFNHREYIFVHRDELVLKGSGHISLGMEADHEHPENIHFELIED